MLLKHAISASLLSPYIWPTMRCLPESNNEYMKDFVSGSNIERIKEKQNDQEKLANLRAKSSKLSEQTCVKLIWLKLLQLTWTTLWVRAINRDKLKQKILAGASR